MNQDRHPHLKLIKTPPPEPDLQYYKHDPTYNYDLDMPKSDLIMLVSSSGLLSVLSLLEYGEACPCYE